MKDEDREFIASATETLGQPTTAELYRAIIILMCAGLILAILYTWLIVTIVKEW